MSRGNCKYEYDWLNQSEIRTFMFKTITFCWSRRQISTTFMWRHVDPFGPPIYAQIIFALTRSWHINKLELAHTATHWSQPMCECWGWGCGGGFVLHDISFYSIWFDWDAVGAIFYETGTKLNTRRSAITVCCCCHAILYPITVSPSQQLTQFHYCLFWSFMLYWQSNWWSVLFVSRCLPSSLSPFTEITDRQIILLNDIIFPSTQYYL